MWRYTLTVPQVLNDGTPLSGHNRGVIELDLIRRFGGFTAHEAQGAWADDDGTVYREPVTVYTLDADEDMGGWLQMYASHLATELRQEAVYVTTVEPTGAQHRTFAQPVTAGL